MATPLIRLIPFLVLSSFSSAHAIEFEADFASPPPVVARPGSTDGAAILLYIVCDFRGGTLDCRDVINGFFSQAGFTTLVKRVNRPEDAHVVLNLTSEMSGTGDEIIRYGWKPIETLGDDYWHKLILNPLLDPLSKLNATILNMSPFLNLLLNTVSASVVEGRLTVVGTSAGEVTAPEPEKPWFMSANASGSLNNQSETASKNGFGSVSYNYSVDKYRIQASAFANYRKSTVADGQGGEIKAENFSRFASLMGVWSFKKNWSVALMFEGGADPGSNIQGGTDITAGVEWSLVPFRINENRELLFRVGFTGTKIRLDDMNVNENLKEKYLSAFANLYMYWLLLDGKASASINGRVKTNLKYKGFESYTIGTNFSVELTKALNANGGFSYGYTAKSITYPATPDYSNPLQLQLLGNQPGGNLGVNFGLGLQLGNGLKARRDRRWSSN